jgi:hypothetical protein
MRSTVRKRLLLVLACLISGQHLWAQQVDAESQATPRVEVAVLYDALLSNVVRSEKFWMQGGSIEAAAQFWRGLGVEADIAGFHQQNASNTGVGLDMLTATFGPRYQWSPVHRRYFFSSHALMGVANGFNSIFPGSALTTGTANGFALQIGGGMDVAIKHRLLLRALEADWLRTQLPNADTNVQNNVRLGAGVVVRFR